MTIRPILRERLSIERGDAEVVREPASLTESDEPALISSLQVPLAQGTSSLLSASAPQRNETEASKDWYDSAGRGFPALVTNPLLTRPVTTRAEMKSRDLLTSLATFSQSLQGLIKPSLIYGARQKVVVPCSKLYKTIATFSQSLQGLIKPSLIYGARQKVVVPCSKLYKTIATFSQSLQGLIKPSLIYGARQKVVVPCSKLYKTVASFSKSLQGLIKPSLMYSARQKMAAGSILLIIIPTAVIGTISGLVFGLIKAKSNVASSLSTGKQTLPLNVSLPPAASALAPSIAPPANSHDENKSLQVRATVKAMRPNPQPSTAHLNLEAPLKNKDTNSLPANAPHGDEKATSRTPLEVRALGEKPASNPPYQAIAVVVQIEQGRVKEAYIQNPQAGLRAFEATALRRARERGYPKETKRKETVILHISANPIKPLP